MAVLERRNKAMPLNYSLVHYQLSNDIILRMVVRDLQVPRIGTLHQISSLRGVSGRWRSLTAAPV